MFWTELLRDGSNGWNFGDSNWLLYYMKIGNFASNWVPINSPKNVLVHVLTMPLYCVGIHSGCNVGNLFRNESLWSREVNTWEVSVVWVGPVGRNAISNKHFTHACSIVLLCVRACRSFQKESDIYIYIYIIAIEFSLRISSPYTNTERTNKNKYT